jgi:hypothetical protein
MLDEMPASSGTPPVTGVNAASGDRPGGVRLSARPRRTGPPG